MVVKLILPGRVRSIFPSFSLFLLFHLKGYHFEDSGSANKDQEGCGRFIHVPCLSFIGPTAGGFLIYCSSSSFFSFRVKKIPCFLITLDQHGWEAIHIGNNLKEITFLMVPYVVTMV